MKIEIKNYKQLDKGSLVGFVSVLFVDSGFYVNDISIFRKGAQQWVNFPSESYEADGKTKYRYKCGYEDAKKKEAFQVALFKALESYTPVPKDEAPVPF